MDFVTTLVLLSVQVFRSWGCLVGCRCYSTTVECGSLGLTAVPTNIPAFTQTIFLQDNNITRISRRDFSHLTKLQNLYIQNNSLDTIEAGALTQQCSLVELALNGNRIQQLDRSIFQGLGHLRVLYLAANQISRLAGFTFHELQRLQELHLQQNNLQSLDEQAFVGLSSLALLDLSDNCLHTLHYASLQPLRSLQELRLIGNHWRCDCSLHWLRAWIVREGHRLLLGKALVCAEPPRLAGHSLPDVPSTSLVCIPPSIQLDRSEAVARPGDELHVACRASGYPPPVLGWRSPGEARAAAMAPPSPRSGGNSAQLVLRNVTASQAGSYVCEAHNAGGRAAATFALLVNTSGPLGPALPPGLSRQPLSEGVDFGALGTASQTGIAAGIGLLALTALLLLLAVIWRRRGWRGKAEWAGAEGPGAAGGLYLNDYSDGPSTFAQLEEYRDDAGREMFVIDRSKRDIRTYKDTAEPGRSLQPSPPQDRATQTAEAEVRKPQQADVFENRGAVFKEEIEYEIHC
ncbi:leucine-rich repeat-containing protein 24 [Mobula hypostoma]|uniref:leucine-rich repeat-containing protein 24 n=1 Tax=Mobula hypostoma TaxID=723540 RepID=UPI002FC2C988